MYYVVEGVHWEAGRISRVRWHRVDLADGDRIRRSASEVVPVVDAGRVCGEHEVRVYVESEAGGAFFRMKACDEGIDADDGAGTPLVQRMAHLPTF